MTYRTIHTQAGLAAIAQAEATGTSINLTHMAVGDGNGNPVEPSESQTNLARELYRHTINRVYQDQQRRDGLLAFWWRYLTSKDWCYRYELEAYRVWLEIAPDDFWKVVSMMQNYGFNISQTELINALSRR